MGFLQPLFSVYYKETQKCSLFFRVVDSATWECFHTSLVTWKNSTFYFFFN